MGVWTTNPKTGKSEYRDEFPDTAEGQKAAQADTDKRANSSSSSATTYNAGNTPTQNQNTSAGAATTGSTSGDQGTNWGFGTGGTGGTGDDRVKSIYEGKDNETLQQWAQRVFRQGTRDYGGALSPDADNPYARTPYANWFQNRYTDVVPANLLLQKLLTNSGMGQDFAPQLQQGMQGFMENGVGRGFGTGTEGAQQNLGKLNDLMESFRQNRTDGMSADQITALGGLMDSPSNQMAMINAQLSGGIGANPLASKYISQLGSQSMNDYFDDVVGQSPSTNGTFMNNFLKRINMAR